MNKSIFLLSLFALPQFAFACTLGSLQSVLDGVLFISVVVFIFGFILLLGNKDFVKPRFKQIFHLLSRGMVWVIIVQSFARVILMVLTRTICMSSPRENYFAGLPLYLFVFSLMFLFIQKRWPSQISIWLFYFVLIALLYAYGYTFPDYLFVHIEAPI